MLSTTAAVRLPLIVRPCFQQDLESVQLIYAHHVLTGFGSFETEPPSLEEMTARWGAIVSKNWPFVVASPAAIPPPTEPEPQGSDFEIARTYVNALSTDASPDDIARFFDSEATDEERRGKKSQEHEEEDGASKAFHGFWASIVPRSALSTPSAIACATSAPTAPQRSISAVGTPSISHFASFE